MARRLLAIVVALALPASAQETELPAGLDGLMPTTVLRDGRPACLAGPAGGALVLRADADADAPSRGELQLHPWPETPEPCGTVDARVADEGGGQPVPTRESDYEQSALLVLEQRAGWRRIALAGTASAWLQTDAPVLPYPQLLIGRLAYATTPEVAPCAEPLAGCAADASAPGSDLEVLSVREVDGQAWLEVQVLTPRCHEGGGQRLARGWLPAQRPDGRPAAWFHSRGC